MGKTVCAIPSPIGTIIYATNMVPVTVYRFNKTEEQYIKDVHEAVEAYQKKRAEEAAKSGEVD